MFLIQQQPTRILYREFPLTFFLGFTGISDLSARGEDIVQVYCA